MESLLSMSFDNLSSYDQVKIRKGLRQVEGLLAQICLSSSTRAEKRRSFIDPAKEPLPRKVLSELGSDPAFREFFKLQDGFEWNVAMRLHLLDLLEPINCPAIQSATIITLACALIETPQNTRAFENLDGLLTITSLFKSRETSREVKLKLVEFLYFYLMPETPSIPSANSNTSAPSMLQHSPSKLVSAFNGREARKRADSESVIMRSTEEKQSLLGNYLSSVDDLVADLRESTPFGGALS
ncbi:cell division control protein 14 [Diplocarpon rosae]|nr:cell division control protein 14 [Diplocarpon rosae]